MPEGRRATWFSDNTGAKVRDRWMKESQRRKDWSTACHSGRPRSAVGDRHLTFADNKLTRARVEDFVLTILGQTASTRRVPYSPFRWVLREFASYR